MRNHLQLQNGLIKVGHYLSYTIMNSYVHPIFEILFFHCIFYYLGIDYITLGYNIITPDRNKGHLLANTFYKL